MDEKKFFEIPKNRIGIRPSDLIQRIVLFVEDTKIVEDRTLANFAVWSKKNIKNITQRILFIGYLELGGMR